MIKDLIEGKTPRERRTIISNEIAKLVIPKIKRKDFEIEIRDIESIEVNGIIGVQMYVRAWDSKGQIGFSEDGSVEWERFRIFNPHFEVADGTKKTVQYFGPDGKQFFREEDNVKEDLQEKTLQDIEYAIERTHRHSPDKIELGKHGSTVSTFYPDGTGSGDQEVFEDTGGQTWATKVAAAGIFGNQLGSNASAVLYVAAHTVSGQWNQLRRAIVTFETAAIDSGDTVTASVLSIWGKGMNSSTMTLGIAMDEFLGSNTDTWDGTEYGILATFWASNRFGTSDISNSSWTNGSYNDFTMSTFTPIKKGVGAVTRLGLRLAQDIDNSTPTWASGVQDGFKWSGYVVAGTTNDPKLVVTHAAAAAAAANLMLLGVGT